MLFGVRFGVLFFSSRRRHTRLQGDWSSDVCSSDLRGWTALRRGRHWDRIDRCVLIHIWLKEKHKSNRAKLHLPKSSGKSRSRGWLCLRESITTLFEMKVLVVKDNVEK